MAEKKDFSNNELDAGESEVSVREREVLEFWSTHNVFKKSEEKDAPKGEYVFYDGPPFATGLPHYGHLLASTIKDAIPRYQTMRGYRVRRRWGWDCHGLPLENEIEKELELKTKKDIEEMGIGKFNEAARSAVLRYADDWKKIIPRLGRWVDMERDYKTMDTSYTESVWWIFKTLFDKKLIYKGFKSMHLCPRCGTSLSNFEVNLGYKDTTDISVYVKLPLVGEENTALLVWTTTPWTLPGNMAAAVNENITYVKAKVGDGYLVVAKDLVEKLGEEYEVVEEMKGKEIVGKSYIPPFSYYMQMDIGNKENAWKVYPASYVSTDEGTGIVHLAPAYGEDDLNLAQKYSIPIVHHVSPEGEFVAEVTDFSGMQAKPKDAPQETDIEIVKYLASHNTLFKKEKITHSYPFCWRCDTPLLNYATSSWFVRVTDFRDKLVSENKKIGWTPQEVGESRFGHWLMNVRDWSISRSRYWGAPLPVWRNVKDGSLRVIGSIEELEKSIKRSGNSYFIMRHGEAEHNVKNIISSKKDTPHHLTEKGKEDVRKAARSLKDIDLIFTSPFVRTKETAELVREELGLGRERIIENEHIGETNAGEFDGKSIDEWHTYFTSPEEEFTKRPPQGENLVDIRKRMSAFMFELERKYSNKKILIISHGDPLWMLFSSLKRRTKEEMIVHKDEDYPKTSTVTELFFVPYPHNENYELDLHRPYIDEVNLVDKEGNSLERIPEVFDCWFESGSMPYAQQHYPFENADTFDPKSGWFKKTKGYPADFIAEGMDQTRGWFYSLLVLGVGLFGKTPYKNVIVNGLVLAEDGKKMSKRLKNYPDPMYIIKRYGADTLRYYLLSSPIVRGEDLSFSEKGVDEVMKKLLVRLSNVLAFYVLYKNNNETDVGGMKSANVLDRWILTRMRELNRDITEAMDNYKLDRATRPIALFIDDLSVWYIRRSRERFKGSGRGEALQTLRTVLEELSKLIAPFMPFYAETLYQVVKESSSPESVHLCAWPRAADIDDGVLADMTEVRRIVSLGLEVRASAGIKVRQPLNEVRIKKAPLLDGTRLKAFEEIIKEELNVKSVRWNVEQSLDVELDTHITQKLREEGVVREIIRHIQQFRKESSLTQKDLISIAIDTDEKITNIIKGVEEDIKKATLLKEIVFRSVSAEPKEVDGSPVAFSIS